MTNNIDNTFTVTTEWQSNMKAYNWQSNMRSIKFMYVCTYVQLRMYIHTFLCHVLLLHVYSCKSLQIEYGVDCRMKWYNGITYSKTSLRLLATSCVYAISKPWSCAVLFSTTLNSPLHHVQIWYTAKR